MGIIEILIIALVSIIIYEFFKRMITFKLVVLVLLMIIISFLVLTGKISDFFSDVVGPTSAAVIDTVKHALSGLV